MSKVNIFKERMNFDLPTLIDSRFLVCANSGGGKSYAVRKLLEETHGKVMSIILDIEGEFKTLREKYDFLLIGENGDVALNLKAAQLLPKNLLELNVSAIVDISDLKRKERIQYVKKFLETLMECPRKLWKPCLVVLDEAHILCGQQEKQDSAYSVIDLMTRGRKRGFCGVLCTQRISKLHKDAVAECNNVMIGRTGLDIDMKRAAEILGFTSKQNMLSLRDLDAGDFFVFGTAISKKVTKVKVGKVKTTHPKVGMDLKSKIVPPTNKIKQMLSKLNELPKEAEEQIRTEQDMKKKIKELTSRLRIAEHSKHKQLDERTSERIRQQAINQTQAKFNNYIKRDQKYIQDLIKRLKQIASLTNVAIPELKQETKPAIIHKQIATPKRETPQVTGDYIDLGLCAKKIYSLLAQYPEKTFSKPQIGVFTGYSHRSGSFNNATSQLRTLGLIEGPSNNLKAKVINANLMEDYNFSKEAIIQKLGKCEKEIYTVLLNNPYEEYLKEQIAEMTTTNYSSNSGSFNNSISRLKTLGILQKHSGKIKLNPELLEI